MTKTYRTEETTVLMTYDKYLIALRIPEPGYTAIINLMDEVAEITGIEPPYKNIQPHVTFHRPIEHIIERKIIDLTRSMSLQVSQTRLTLSHLYNFGKEYAVLPVHATKGLADFWIGINKLLSLLPEYRHGKFDDDNTLHITIANNLSPVFDSVWPLIQDIRFTLSIPVSTIDLLGANKGKAWNTIEEFHLRP
jgi:2'-5' RNA ligase